MVVSRPIGSQRELQELLAASGHEVTQATVSRDLEAVGAVRLRAGDGVYRYEIGPVAEQRDEVTAALSQAIGEFVHWTAASGNIVVIKVPPGAAHLVASRIDGAAIDGVLGTVAGDDTLLVVVSEARGAAAVAEEIERMGGPA